MPQLIIPGAYMAAIHGEVSGQEVVNVLGFKSEGFGAAPAIAQALQTVWTGTGGVLPLLPNVYKLTKIKVTDLASANSEVYELAVNKNGLSTNGMAVLSACAIIRIGSPTRARSGKGRVYLGPLQASHITGDGRSLSTNANPILPAVTKVMTDMKAAGFPWAVLSRKLSTASEVTSVSVAPIIGTQRRRIR